MRRNLISVAHSFWVQYQRRALEGSVGAIFLIYRKVLEEASLLCVALILSIPGTEGYQPEPVVLPLNVMLDTFLNIIYHKAFG